MATNWKNIGVSERERKLERHEGDRKSGNNLGGMASLSERG